MAELAQLVRNLAEVLKLYALSNQSKRLFTQRHITPMKGKVNAEHSTDLR